MSYSKNFFKDKEPGAVLSARKVVPIIMEMFSIESVTDFGCGNGTWLSVFLDHGVKHVNGFDGNWVIRDDLLIPENTFTTIDFEENNQFDQKADLAISLEVAEHLSTNGAKKLIKLLTETSDVVLFSAAIPGQGGTNHINEQWPSYWIQEFSKHNYCVMDVIRWQIWEDNEVESWYKQNLLVFIREGVYKAQIEHFQKAFDLNKRVFDVVHPETFNGKIQELNNLMHHSLPKILLSLPGIVKRKILFKVNRKR